MFKKLIFVVAALLAMGATAALAAHPVAVSAAHAAPLHRTPSCPAGHVCSWSGPGFTGAKDEVVVPATVGACVDLPFPERSVVNNSAHVVELFPRLGCAGAAIVTVPAGAAVAYLSPAAVSLLVAS